MPEIIFDNSAGVAAQAAFEKVKECIDQNRSFVLEAGAGAGKTYSLIDSLKYILVTQGKQLQRQNQRVACITYTNVAKDEIEARTDKHPVIFTDTIHAFSWSLIRDFQSSLRTELPTVGKWPERIAEQGEIGTKRVIYDLGYPFIDVDSVSLSHDDVLALAVRLFPNEKFRKLWVGRYPVLLIDEYQDTDADFVVALKQYFLGASVRPLIGLFGDHWQKIYGDGCGKVENEYLEFIPKHANFRSVRPIVDFLNRMRPELTQEIQNEDTAGSAKVYHSNNWQGIRRTGAHWNGDLPQPQAQAYLREVQGKLTDEGWDFSPKKTKVLMLTHKVLASEQDYRNLADVFDRNEAFTKKEDGHIEFLVDVVEVASEAYQERHFGQMFEALKMKTPAIRSYADKANWSASMDRLLELRSTGSVGEVIDFLADRSSRIRLPEPILRREQRRLLPADQQSPEDAPKIERLNKLRAVPYSEVTALSKYLNGHTCFATKHGVKGAEFENVLVVVGRGWSKYNFDSMLGFLGNRVPADKQKSYEESRNLFYVACSRPKKRLALLFTQKLSPAAMTTLNRLFGPSMVSAL